MKKCKGKILSGITAFIMLLSIVFSTPITVMATGTFTPTLWSDTINGSTGDWNLNDGDTLDLRGITNLSAGSKTITVANGASVKIIGATGKTFTNLAIIIKNGTTVTIENLNITNDTFASSPIIAGDGTDNKLIILGTNNIKATVNNCAGISVVDTTRLSIMGVDANSEIIVHGGGCGAGIGGGSHRAGGTIAINDSAEVTATGGINGAGIGGGSEGAGGTIIINDSAKVTATGGIDGAGIGGGSSGNGGVITINGGAKVIATGGNNGAGIGGGRADMALGVNGGIITINDNAEVTATGGDFGAGIGSGYADGPNGGGIITINDSAEVTATGGNNGAGIGGGYFSVGGTITIDGNPNIIAIGNDNSNFALNGTITSSLPIIAGKLSLPLSTTSNTNINITDISNSSNNKSLIFPAGAYSFSSTVLAPGDYTVDAGNKSLVKTGTPIGGIYNLSSAGLYEYPMTTGCKVTFDSQGGTPAIQYGFLTSGNTVSAPASQPIKDGHLFEGWYKEPSCINEWNFGDVVNANITLYAKYPPLATGMAVSTAAKTPAASGKVMLTVTPGASDAGHKVYYKVVDAEPSARYVGDGITVGEWTEVTNTNPFEINAADGKYVEAIEINAADNKVTKWGKSSATNDGYTAAYEIGLSETGTLTFADQTEGYSSVAPKSVTVTKTGNEAITSLAAALSGTNEDSFTLGALNTTTLNNTINSTIVTIKPKDNLHIGNYAATVTINADNGVSQSFNVSFKVISDNSTPNNPVIQTTPAAVTIKGTQRVGKTLEALLLKDGGAEFTTSAAVTYEWYRLSSKDAGNGELVGNDKTYNLVSSDADKYIKIIASLSGKNFEAITGRIENIVPDAGSNPPSSPSINWNTGSNSSSSSSNSSSSSSNSSSSPSVSSTENKDSGKIPNGWQKQSDNTWKYGENGQYISGWKLVDGFWYLFDSTGTMQIGWRQLGNEWYYLEASGAMSIGWELIDGKWYLLGNNGAMITGWAQVDGKWYYLNSNGAMATGWINVDGKWYYLYGDGSLAVSTVINGYIVDENGVWESR